MISVPEQAIIYFIPDAMSSEQGIDHYVAHCQRYQLNPRSGDIFVFKDAEGIMLGLLRYDGTGYQWCIKRLSAGVFPSWPSSASGVVKIAAHELNRLLYSAA